MTQAVEYVEPAIDSARVQGLIMMLSLLALVCAIAVTPADPPSAKPQSQSHLTIDINAAAPRELALLPGVGPVLARRIWENRDQQGPFASPDEIGRVSGVGRKTIEKFQIYATVHSADAPHNSRAEPVIPIEE